MQLSLIIIFFVQIAERNYYVLEVAVKLNQVGRRTILVEMFLEVLLLNTTECDNYFIYLMMTGSDNYFY